MEMNFIAFLSPGNCVCTQYAALSRALLYVPQKIKLTAYSVTVVIGDEGRGG